jgi:hypothetical protein
MTMDIREASGQLRALDHEFEEYRVGLSALNIEVGSASRDDGPPSLEADGRRFALSDKGFGRLCRFLKAPADYVRALPPGLQGELIRHHLDEMQAEPGAIGLITHGGELVGLARTDLARLSGQEVLEAAVEGVPRPEGELDVVDLSIRGESLRFDLIAQGDSHEVTPQDVLKAGVRVRHSLIGESATLVEGFVLRLVCQNGMTHRECLGPRRTPRTRRLPASQTGARTRQLDQIRRLSAEAFERLGERLGQLGQLTREPADFGRLTESWLRRARLSPDRLVPILREAWETEGSEATTYGVMNAFTRVASHGGGLPERTRDMLGRLGGLLAFRHEHLCPRCWSLIHSGDN